MQIYIKTPLVESVFAGGGEMGARMRALDWSATVWWVHLEQWPQSLRACVRIVLGSGYPMLISWGPDYTYALQRCVRCGWSEISTRRRWARAAARCFPEAWDYIGPLFDKVYTEGSYTGTLASQLFTIFTYNYLEECYFAFSYSPIPDDDGQVGGVLTTVLDMTERVIEDRRRQVLRDLASRTAEARDEDEVWRVSAEALGQHRTGVPFAFLYEYRRGEHQARLASVSAKADDELHPTVIDCNNESIWRFGTALSEDCLVVELGQRSAALSIPGWPLPAQKAQTVLPIRLRGHSEAAAFLVLGNPSGAGIRRRLSPLRSPDRGANRHWTGQRSRV